jgi:hypothetical protein
MKQRCRRAPRHEALAIYFFNTGALGSETLLAVALCAEPASHTPPGCLADVKPPFPAVQLEAPLDAARPAPQVAVDSAFLVPKLSPPAIQLELPLDVPPPPAGVEPVVAFVFALFASVGLEAEVFCARAASRKRAKATANAAMENAFLRFAQCIDSPLSQRIHRGSCDRRQASFQMSHHANR